MFKTNDEADFIIKPLLLQNTYSQLAIAGWVITVILSFMYDCVVPHYVGNIWSVILIKGERDSQAISENLMIFPTPNLSS